MDLSSTNQTNPRVLTPEELVAALLNSAQKARDHVGAHPILEQYHLPHDVQVPTPPHPNQK